MLAMGYVTTLFARKMVAAAGGGVDASTLLRDAEIDRQGSWDTKAVIPAATYYDLLERIAERVDATDLPVRVGASMNCNEYGALGLAWKAARDLHGSLSRVERYARLWTGVVSYELRPDPAGLLYVLHRQGERRLGMRLSNETTLVATISLARQVSREPVVPLEVRVQHPAPKCIAKHEDWFGCPVLFGADLDAILLPSDVLHRPNILADEGISNYLISQLDAELSRFADEADLVSHAKRAVALSLSEGVPRMTDIARALGMSGRTLHRRLAEYEVSFQTLTEETRRELAEGLLRADQHTLAEIAFLTGFSEQSSFTRAFKRWVGHTPTSYRKAQQRR